MRERDYAQHETATYCTSLGEKAPTPVGAGGGRVALLARRNARNSPSAVFFLPSFFFWAYMGKRKSGGGSVETHCGYCLRAEFTLGSPSGGAPAKRVRGEEKPSPSRQAVPPLPRGEAQVTTAHPSVCHPERRRSRSRTFAGRVKRASKSVRP